MAIDLDGMLREFERDFGRQVLKRDNACREGVVADHPLCSFRDGDDRLAQASLFVLADVSADVVIERWFAAGNGGSS